MTSLSTLFKFMLQKILSFLVVLTAPCFGDVSKFSFPKVKTELWGQEVEYRATIFLEPIFMNQWVLLDPEDAASFPWYRCLNARTRADLFDDFEEFYEFFDPSFMSEIGGQAEFEKAFEFSKKNLEFQHYQPDQLTVFAEHRVHISSEGKTYLVVEFVQQHENSAYFSDRDIKPLPHTNVTAVSFIAFSVDGVSHRNYYITDDSFLSNFKVSSCGLKGILSRYGSVINEINSMLLKKIIEQSERLYSEATNEKVIADLLLNELYKSGEL